MEPIIDWKCVMTAVVPRLRRTEAWTSVARWFTTDPCSQI
jgi:hypothetical protein